MTRNIDLEDLKRQARVCAEHHSTGIYTRHYAGRLDPVIYPARPGVETHWRTRFFTHDYEELAGVSAAVARKRLRRLVADGFLIEDKTAGGCTSWRFFNLDESHAVGVRIIDKLVSRGLQFDKCIL